MIQEAEGSKDRAAARTGDDQVWKDQQLQRALDLRGGGHPIGAAVKAALDAGADPDAMGIPGSGYYGITPRMTAAGMARDMESQTQAGPQSPFSPRADQVLEIARMFDAAPKSAETLAREQSDRKKDAQAYLDGTLFRAVEFGLGVEKIAELVAAGASVHARDLTGKTPLLSALHYGSAEQARKLLDLGADPRAADSNGNTAAIEAAKLRSAECVRLVLTAGADPHAPNNEGRTPLMTAAINGNEAPARLLIEAGAELSAVDKRGFSANDYARGRAKTYGDDACLTAIGEALRVREERAALLSATEGPKLSADARPAALGRDGRPARSGPPPRAL